MITKQLHETLLALKHESNNINSNDTDAVDTLNQLIDKLEQQLSEPEISDHRNLLEQLQESINKFEVTHPAITSTVNDLMVKLAGLGV